MLRRREAVSRGGPWELVSVASIVGAAIMLAMMLVFSVPVFGAVEKPPNDNFGGNPTSAEHRANASGKGNFVQCHSLGAIEDEYSSNSSNSSTYNPSSQNAGEADCRKAGGLVGTNVTNCPGAVVQYADTHIIFHPRPDVIQVSVCEF